MAVLTKSPDIPNLQSETTLRDLVKRLREGIYVTNRAGDILDANPAFLEMFGVESLERTIGRADQNLIQVRFDVRGFENSRRDR